MGRPATNWAKGSYYLMGIPTAASVAYPISLLHYVASYPPEQERQRKRGGKRRLELNSPPSTKELADIVKLYGGNKEEPSKRVEL